MNCFEFCKNVPDMEICVDAYVYLDHAETWTNTQVLMKGTKARTVAGKPLSFEGYTTLGDNVKRALLSSNGVQYAIIHDKYREVK